MNEDNTVDTVFDGHLTVLPHSGDGRYLTPMVEVEIHSEDQELRRVFFSPVAARELAKLLVRAAEEN